MAETKGRRGEQVMDLRDMERAVIAQLMYESSELFLEHTKGLTPEMFSYREGGWLFEVMRDRILRGQGIRDVMLLVADLAANGHKEMDVVSVAKLIAVEGAIYDLRGCIEQIIDSYRRRQVEQALQSVARHCQDLEIPIEQTISQAISTIVGTGGLAEDNTITLGDMLMKIEERVVMNGRGDMVMGYPTGITSLDVSGGLHPKDLVIVAGMSSHGKTALAMTMVRNAVRLSDVKALIVSMEMDGMQIGARLLAPEVRMPASVILYHRLQSEGQRVMKVGLSNLSPIADRVFIGDSSVQTLDGILGSIRLHHVRYGIRLVVIDYAQIIGIERQRDMTREEGLAEIARKLKNIAKELDICVILLSQLNRDAVHSLNPEPSASQLRGSGQINEAADLTLLIYRPVLLGMPYREPFADITPIGTALLKVDKDRNGGYGGPHSFIVAFDAQTTQVKDRIMHNS